MTARPIRICGVPEHFNIPFHIALDRGLFAAAGLNVEWRDVKEGTGRMVDLLKNNETDCMVGLTEGIVAAIAHSAPIRLIATYVRSPLTWSISTGMTSDIHNVEDIRHSTVAVSRMMSGSHLMTCVLASQRGWKQSDITYAPVGTFEKLRESVNAKETSVFMWERFMSKPYYDSGTIRAVGTIVTPWPCFCIAATSDVIEERLSELQTLLSVVRRACQIFKAESADSIAAVSKQFNLTTDDAKAWFDSADIVCSSYVSQTAVEKTIAALLEAGIITSAEAQTPINKFIDDRLVAVSTDIQNMKLYNKPELITVIHNNLRSINASKGEISYKTLLPYDQNYYWPITALQSMAKDCHLTAGKRCINIGSNLGGPARYICAEYNVECLAVELQYDLSQNAAELTDRCNDLIHKPRHISANIIELLPLLNTNTFDCIFSFLTLLHLTRQERNIVILESSRILLNDGYLFIEDFIIRDGNTLTDEEKLILYNEVYCRELTTIKEYLTDINETSSSSLSIISVEDSTESWNNFVHERLNNWHNNKQKYINIHGLVIYQRLDYFYSIIVRLFEGGNIGGVRILAQKKKINNT